MIKFQEYTPGVYYRQSRDFQFIGRLYDLILNYVKTQTDTLYNLPFSDNFNPKLVDLMTLTLGFRSKHNYNLDQLISLCSSFCEILRNKGNTQSIQMACDTLTRAEGLTERIIFTVDEENFHVDFFVPEDLSDINLLKDILIYILPAGMTYAIYRSILDIESASTKSMVRDSVTYSREMLQDIETSLVVDKIANNDGWMPRQIPGWINNTTVISPHNSDPDKRHNRPEVSISESGILKVTSTDDSTTDFDVYVDYEYKNVKEEDANGNKEK